MQYNNGTNGRMPNFKRIIGGKKESLVVSVVWGGDYGCRDVTGMKNEECVNILAI